MSKEELRELIDDLFSIATFLRAQGLLRLADQAQNAGAFLLKRYNAAGDDAK